MFLNLYSYGLTAKITWKNATSKTK